jgi:predicted ATPase/class 3 adenylate cyclase/DNA-binding CsgD family transcriptional regulator
MGDPGTARTLPVQTVTFLLTDVDRSTWVSEAVSEASGGTIDRQFELVRNAVVAHGGGLPDGLGQDDSVVAAFPSSADAVAAALDAQRALVAQDWPQGTSARVRIALHTGEAQLRDEHSYTGVALHRCARLCDIAHGGQTLSSEVTASLVAGALPEGASLVDLGSHRLRDLSRPQNVFELRHPDVPGDFPPLRSLDVLPNNLPAQLTSFVGRGDELVEVERLLTRERLVTLSGSGGCGKTRLAVQAAAALADRWPDGVWWVDLGPVRDPSLVAKLTASTLGVLVDPGAGPLRALTQQLPARRLLLCLDNCEHLLDASAALADALLRACPDVSVLTTSREPLGVPGEMVWRVPPLNDDEAVRLFADRAVQVRPEFAVDGTTEEPVRTVCRRLDGIPLAIELAAAWVRVLSPAQIAAGLDQRFRLLTGAPRGVIHRQQTLAASVDWSHDLLDEIDKTLFRRLGVFTGGFSLDAARATCAGECLDEGDVLDALGRLVDKSLVLVDDHGGEARYRLLETVREYADDRLHAAGETAATRDRHLNCFLALAEAAEPELERADQDAWLARLETEHDNLRAALEWGLSAADPEPGKRLAAALPQLWYLHGHANEGINFLRQAIALAPDDRSFLQTSLHAGAALVAVAAGNFEVLTASTKQGYEIATANGDERNAGRCLLLSAYVQFYVDFAAARALAVQGRRHAEAAGDEFATDFSLLLEGLALNNGDRHKEARPILAAALEGCLQRGNRLLASFTLGTQAYGAVWTGDVRRAVELMNESRRLAEPLGDYFTIGSATSNLAWIQGFAGEIDASKRLMQTILPVVEDAGPGIDVPILAFAMGKLHLWTGEFEDAATWFERCVQRYAGPMADNWVVAKVLPGLAASLRLLGRREGARQQVERAVAVARKLGVPHALAEALEQSAFLINEHDPDQAEDLHHEALAVRVAHGLRTFYVDSLDALAGLAVRAKSFSEAARLLAASDAAREAMGYPRPPVDQPAYDATRAQLRSALDQEAFTTAWKEGDSLSLDDAVAYAARARGARGRPSFGWASLTPTELAVIRLVVEGLTNPEIGERLFISRATVKTHLSHVYNKLGVANRTELATFANAQPATPAT